jgi:hypothetical protein
MSDQPEESSPTKAVFKLVAYPFIVLVLYVLSVGPAFKMQLPTTFLTVYTPLVFIEDHSELARTFFNWYLVDLWKCPQYH